MSKEAGMVPLLSSLSELIPAPNSTTRGRLVLNYFVKPTRLIQRTVETSISNPKDPNL